MSADPGRPAVFLDRDGTLIDELGFLVDPARLRLLPGVAAAVARLNAAGRWVGVVTNQSGIARGLLDEGRLAEIHERLAELLAAEGAHLDGIAWCPHHPTEGRAPWRRACDCRKPAPGLLEKLAAEHGLDLASSWVVGDAARDLEAGRRAGVGGLILVGTGKGRDERASLPPELADGTLFADDLAAAAELVLAVAPQGR